MNHRTPLDELHHYLGQLRIDVMLGVDRRHLVATARLCHLIIERIDAANPESRATLNQTEYKTLQIQLLDLQREISGAPVKANPRARRVGDLRVIDGGKSVP